MKHPSQIAVTTTPDLAGSPIATYLGIVSAHIVAGTNIFSDVFGALSDVFGGRSKSYRNALSAINEEAIDELREKAAKLGGDAIVGLTIDHDEVSGGGKTMFMVTAIGTAVTLEEPVHQQTNGPGNRTLSSDDLDRLIERRTIVSQLREEKPTKLPRDTWRFLIENGLSEVADEVRHIADTSLRSIDDGSGGQKETRDLLSEYLASIEADIAEDVLYRLVLSANLHAAEYAHAVIEAFGCLDWTRIQSMLESEDIDQRRAGLNLLVTFKSDYSKEDLPMMEEIAATLENAFPDRTKTVEHEGGILSKAKTKWKCPCGTANSIGSERCDHCLRDRRGLFHRDEDPTEVAAFLRDCRDEIAKVIEA